MCKSAILQKYIIDKFAIIHQQRTMLIDHVVKVEITKL